MHHRMLCRGLIMGLVSWSAACVEPPPGPGVVTDPMDMSQSDLATMDDMDMSKIVADGGADSAEDDGGMKPADMPPDAASTCVCGAPGCLETECTNCEADNDCGGLMCDPDTFTCVTCMIDGGQTLGCDENAPACVDSECVECDESDSRFSTSLNKCVACLNDDHCPDISAPRCNDSGECTACEEGNAGSRDKNAACVSSSAGDPMMPYCVSENCVECLFSSDCNDVTKPTCRDNRCVPCDDNAVNLDSADCFDTSAGASPQCFNATCVECSTDAHCPGPGVGMAGRRCISNECEDIAPESVSVGNSCAYDRACEQDAACVPLNYGNATNSIGSYCLFEKDRVGTCPKPWGAPIFKSSEGNSTGRDFCGLLEDKTRPEAILLHTFSMTSCTDANDTTTCGEGALCGDRNGPFQCTYECTDNAQCIGTCVAVSNVLMQCRR